MRAMTAKKIMKYTENRNIDSMVWCGIVTPLPVFYMESNRRFHIQIKTYEYVRTFLK